MGKFWSTDDLVRYGDATEKPARMQKILQNMHKLLSWKYVTEDDTERFRGFDPSRFGTFGPETESALIVADTETSPLLYHTMAGMLPMFDVDASIAIMPRNDHPNGPVPREVAGALRETDLIVNMCTYTISHSEAMQKTRHTIVSSEESEANERGVPSPSYLLLANATEDMFLQGALDADPQEVFDLTIRAAEYLREGEWVEVTSRHGTDFEFSVEDVPGDEIASGGFPFGSTSICPLPQDSVNGTVVHDSFMMGIGLLDDPIIWEVEDGWIQEIQGGAEAEALLEYLDQHGDENSRAFAEFAIVTNPEARPNGNYFENKFVGGGLHIALGDNTSYGGPHASSIHLDGVQLWPTVKVDGETIIEDGEMLFKEEL